MAHEPGADEAAEADSRLSRRGFLVGGLGAAATVAALGVGLDACSSSSGPEASSTSVPAVPEVVAFYGPHQAGIATPAQQRLVFATFDVIATDRGDLGQVLKLWTGAAAAMTQGLPVPGVSDNVDAPPADTGEAQGLAPANLTITIGYGPSLFDHRFGLAAKRPKLLTTLPPLPNENLDPGYVGGDIAVQVCSEDPLVAFHAVRDLARIAIGTVALRWMEIGFGSTARTTQAITPRNLLGFKDGTRNLDGNDAALMDKYVWLGDETDQPWLRGGSYLIARRIEMFIESWDRDRLGDQQNVIGRFKLSGAPLTGQKEFDTPDLGARDSSGDYVIPDNAHIRLASPDSNGGIHIRRRGYSFTDGIDPELGTLLGGLFFIAYMQSPNQFIALQRRLGHSDALNEYIRHTGSGIFVCPPGLPEGSDWSAQLLG